MFLLLVLSDIFDESIFVLLVKIVILLDTFKQHLLEIFFQHEVKEMEIHEILVQIKVQNLRIVG
jgi:hypothetical protein